MKQHTRRLQPDRFSNRRWSPSEHRHSCRSRGFTLQEVHRRPRQVPLVATIGTVVLPMPDLSKWYFALSGSIIRCGMSGCGEIGRTDRLVVAERCLTLKTPLTRRWRSIRCFIAMIRSLPDRSMSLRDVDVGRAFQRPDVFAWRGFDLADRLRRQVHHGVNVARHVRRRATGYRCRNARSRRDSRLHPVIVEALTDGADTRLNSLTL